MALGWLVDEAFAISVIERAVTLEYALVVELRLIVCEEVVFVASSQDGS